MDKERSKQKIKTKTQIFQEIKEVITQSSITIKADLCHFIDEQIAFLTNKKKNRLPKENQANNVFYKDEILDILYSSKKPLTVAEIKARSKTFSQWNGSQRLSMLLSQLGEKGTNQVEKITEKRISYFKLTEKYRLLWKLHGKDIYKTRKLK